MKNKYFICGDVTEIDLVRRNGEIIKTIISTKSLERVREFLYTWGAHFDTKGNRYYVFGNLMLDDGSQKTIKLHRWILDAPDNVVVDHINSNSLDNRLENLRFATYSQNAQNRKGLDKNNTSGYRGVSWDKRYRKWYTYLTINNQRKYLGRYEDIEEAAQVVSDARKKYMPYSRN